MLKLRLLRFVAAVVFGFSVMASLVFGVGFCAALARGGLEGVAHWINHITYEGTLQITEVSPGAVRVTMPVIKHVYLHFAFNWLFMIGLACASFYLRKLCTRRIETKELRAQTE
jgi:hypothetical protein